MYSRCPSCRINHRDGAKHIYKATHKKKLRTILDKAAQKLVDLRVLGHLERPSIRPPQPKFKPLEKSYWCWFCEEEVDNASNVFYCEAVLRHLSTREHHETVHAFWQTTAAPAREKDQFLITLTQWEQNAPVRSGSGGLSVPRQTSIAYGENLTVITVPKLREGQGNIHTGAKPPWLSYGDDATTSATAGVRDEQALSPKEELRRTIEELMARKEAEKKAKNPNRVGGWYVDMKRQREARGEPADNEWLPSFGGVWNEGPRSMHARKHRAQDDGNSRPSRAPLPSAPQHPPAAGHNPRPA